MPASVVLDDLALVDHLHEGGWAHHRCKDLFLVPLRAVLIGGRPEQQIFILCICWCADVALVGGREGDLDDVASDLSGARLPGIKLPLAFRYFPHIYVRLSHPGVLWPAGLVWCRWYSTFDESLCCCWIEEVPRLVFVLYLYLLVLLNGRAELTAFFRQPRPV